VITLGVQRVGGDDRTGDLDAVQQGGEQGDLVGLDAHVHLAQHHAVTMVEGSEQVTPAFATVTQTPKSVLDVNACGGHSYLDAPPPTTRKDGTDQDACHDPPEEPPEGKVARDRCDDGGYNEPCK
jgi:hypothetical protein